MSVACSACANASFSFPAGFIVAVVVNVHRSRHAVLHLRPYELVEAVTKLGFAIRHNGGQVAAQHSVELQSQHLRFVSHETHNVYPTQPSRQLIARLAIADAV